MSAARKLAMFDPDGDGAGGSPPIRSDAMTVAWILDWHLESKRGKQCKDVEFEHARIYRQFAGACGKLRVLDARPNDLLKFLEERLKGKSAWTIKRWNTSIQRAFNLAVKMGLILNNPFKGLTFPAGENGRDWTTAEYQIVMRVVGPILRRFFTFMRFSGMRPGEVRNLLWSDIRPEIGAIIIAKHKTAKKTGKPRRVPLNSVLTKLLIYQRQHVPIGSTHVFLTSRDEAWSMRALNMAFYRCREKVGLPKDLRIHGLRHTFCSHAIMNGIDSATLAQIVGHCDIKTTQRYVHLSGQMNHLIEAMEKAVQPQRKDGAS